MTLDEQYRETFRKAGRALGQLLLQAERPAEAAEVYWGVLAREPTAIEAIRGLCRSRVLLGDRAGLRRDRRDLVARLAGYYGVADEEIPDGKAPDEEVLDEDVAALFDEAERQLEAAAAVGRAR